MTKEEFLNYVDSFGKDKGEFTEEELYEIGTRYKEEIRLSEKNWTELVDLLGVVDENGDLKNGEAFRCWIKAKQKEDGTLKKNVKLLTGQTIEDISMPDLEDKLAEIKREHYKDLTKVRDEYNLYRNVLREDARTERFYENIKESISKFQPLPSVEINTNIDCREVEAVMLLSDLHIGMQIDNFANKYNTQIARKRVMYYVSEVIRLCKESNVKRLNIVNLNDCIDGNIHVTSRIEQDENVINQIIIASEILSEALNQLQTAAPEVIYRAVTDNHSRATQNFRDNIEKENFSRLIDFYLKARLQNTNIVFANDNVDYDISRIELLNGKTMVCVHGHHDSPNSSLQAYMGAFREYIDYICMGHFHETKIKSFQGAKVFVNGSVCGNSPYSVSKRLFGDPEQTLLIFDGNVLKINIVGLLNC